MQHPDEGTIHAWLDGALSPDESAAIEAHVAVCADCQSLVAEARGLIAASSRIVSSLDNVPSGAVPEKRRRAAMWYSTAQFRAAAAILIVATATVFVTRSGSNIALPEASTSERAQAPVQAPAHAPAQAPAPKTMTVASTADGQSASVPSSSNQSSAEGSRAEKPRAKISAGIPADRAVAPQSQTDERAFAQRSESSKNDSVKSPATGLSDVTVTGAAALEERIPLRQVRADTTGLVVTTVYATASGIEVTLTEKRTLPMVAAAPAPSLKAAAAQRAAAPIPPIPTVTERDRSKVVINAISWTDKLGRSQTLSGPAAKEELEAIRKLLSPDRR